MHICFQEPICNKIETFLTSVKYRVREKYLMILWHSCEWNCWRGEFVLQRASSETRSISFAMERWSVERRAFAVETYLKNDDSVFVTQRLFHRHFNIHRNDSVPSQNTVLLWVRNCRETASAAKRKRSGREPSLRTPEIIEQLGQSFVRSPPLAGMCWQRGTSPHRHYIQEVNSH
jgi:site-specific recombinase